jgi:ABC-type amino acid transport system permease subunit
MPQFTLNGQQIDAVDEAAARRALHDLGMQESPAPRMDYAPLIDTLRIYAGWLLACLGTVFALGTHGITHKSTWIPAILMEWVRSPLILQVTFLTFMFLLLSSIHRLLGRGLWKGISLIVTGFVLIVLFRINT